MFGKLKENGIWFAQIKKCDIRFRGHDALYIAINRLRIRLMKPKCITTKIWQPNRVKSDISFV